MVSESSEDVRAQRCQRACESTRAASHPPGQSAVRLDGEELRVTVSVSSVRWRGQAAELPGATAHSGGRERGREQASNRLPGGRNEGSGAIALRIDGDVGVATGFSMSVSRPSYGRAETLDRSNPLWQDTRETSQLAVPSTGVARRQVLVQSGTCLCTLWGTAPKTQRQIPDTLSTAWQCAVTTLLQPARILTTSAIENKR